MYKYIDYSNLSILYKSTYSTHLSVRLVYPFIMEPFTL